MQRLEVSGAVRRIYESLGFKGLGIYTVGHRLLHLLENCYSLTGAKLSGPKIQANPAA